MGAWLAVPFRVIGRRWLLWLALTVAGVVMYYAGLLSVMLVRFHALPNYTTFYHFVDSYVQIWHSTPSAHDALGIMADEPLLEIGYRNPLYGIAEWTLTIVLPNLLQVGFVSALGATFMALVLESRRLSCPAGNAGKAAVGLGAAIMAVCSASLTWVVCCATPSWVVALSIMGVSLSLAQAMDPLGTPLALTGVGLIAVAIALQSRRLAAALHNELIQ